MRAISIGIPFIRRRSGVPIDAQAQAHFNRVIADGGVVPSGLSGVNAFFSAVKAIYGTSDINTAISAAYDPHYLGYKLGAGSGTTLGQAAQTLYSVKGTENLLLHSEDFGNAYWSKYQISVTTNSTTAPNSTTTADTITGNAGTDNKFVFATAGDVGQNTFSVYVKYNTHQFVQLILTNATNTNYANFDLQNGVLGNYVGGTPTITSVGNGWYRLTYANTINTSGNSVRVYMVDSATSARLSTTSSTGSYFIWGAQLNIGSIALPYTQTTTTQNLLADVTQTTAASQPLLLAHTGENYWWGSGVTGNFVQTPNAAANNIVNDFDIKITATYIFNSTFNAYIGKWDSGQQSWRLYLDTGNRLIWNIQGHALYPSNAINSTMNHLRVTRQASNGEIKYFFSTQALNTPIESITWTQLGTTQIGPTGSAPTTTSSLRIGQEQGNPFNGRIYRVTLANAIDGTPVVDFNPSSYNPATSQTQWTSATGEVWSINVGTATSGYKAALVTKSIVQGDGIDDTLIRSTLPSIQYFSQYIALNPLTIIPSGGEYYVDGGGAMGLIYGNAGQVRAWNGSEIQFTGANDNRLNLYNANYNGVSSTAYKNNALNSSGNTGTNISNMISLFSNGSGGSFSNSIINTIVKSLTVDNTTVNTAMYNALRGFDNNAY